MWIGEGICKKLRIKLDSNGYYDDLSFIIHLRSSKVPLPSPINIPANLLKILAPSEANMIIFVLERVGKCHQYWTKAAKFIQESVGSASARKGKITLVQIVMIL